MASSVIAKRSILPWTRYVPTRPLMATSARLVSAKRGARSGKARTASTSAIMADCSVSVISSRGLFCLMRVATMAGSGWLAGRLSNKRWMRVPRLRAAWVFFTSVPAIKEGGVWGRDSLWVTARVSLKRDGARRGKPGTGTGGGASTHSGICREVCVGVCKLVLALAGVCVLDFLGGVAHSP